MTEGLPRGWCRAPLECLVENFDGKRVPVKASDRAQIQGRYPYYGASGIIDMVDGFLFDGDYLLVAEDGANLLSRSTPIAFQAHGKFWVNNHAHIVRPHFDAPLGYLEGFLNSIDLAPFVTGTAQPKLTQKALNRIDVPVPPLNEQRRIVAKLEALQARSRRAREALDAVPPLLEKLRQSILAAAFRGDLTKDWRAKNKDVEPATELLKRIRAERKKKWEEAELAKMKAKGKPPTDDKWKAKYKEPEPVDVTGLPELPKGWCWASLDELLCTMTSGSRGWSKYYGRGTGTFVMAQNVRPWKPDFAERQIVDPPEHDAERSRTLVESGDLLLTIVGANTGDVCLVEQIPAEYFVCQSVALLRPVDSNLARCLVAYLNTERGGKGQLEKFAYGQGRPHLGFEHLRAVAVPLPGGEELGEVCSRIEVLLDGLEPHRSFVAGSVRLLDTLGQACLSKAFRGELVPQDPNDEPADAMLARLGAAKTDSSAPERAAKRGAAKRGVRA